MTKYYKSDVSYRIIGCALKVHKKLWCGFQEVIYQRALSLDFQKEWLIFEREKEMKIYYNDVEIWTRRVDFLVDWDIMVELKAITKTEEVNKAQIINYLEAYWVKLWLLINFWAKQLETSRFIK